MLEKERRINSNQETGGKKQMQIDSSHITLQENHRSNLFIDRCAPTVHAALNVAYLSLVADIIWQDKYEP